MWSRCAERRRHAEGPLALGPALARPLGPARLRTQQLAQGVRFILLRFGGGGEPLAGRQSRRHLNALDVITGPAQTVVTR